MAKVIVYKKDGILHFIRPTLSALNSGITIEQIAQKDVPFGLPYKIIDNSELPGGNGKKGDYRDGWDIDEAELTDGVGADYGAGSKNQAVGWAKNTETGEVLPVIKEIIEEA